MCFTPPLLATITARTLIVFGDRDFLYPVSLAFDLHAAIPNSHLWVVPNGGHGPVFGAHAPQFAETALAFLRGEWPQSEGPTTEDPTRTEEHGFSKEERRSLYLRLYQCPPWCVLSVCYDSPLPSCRHVASYRD